MKLLIIEDETLAAKRIRKMVEELYEKIEIVGITDSIESSVNFLKMNEHPDLILMDIELADGQSFEIFNQVDVKSTIIFTTAYDEYAIRAFKVNSIDYLLKPITQEDLKRGIEKYKQWVTTHHSTSAAKIDLDSIVLALREKHVQAYKRRFLVKQGQKYIPLEIQEIAYFYTEDKVSFIRTFTDLRFVVDHSLDELEQLLDPVSFFRANRQFIVSPQSLNGIHNHFNGKLKINLKPIVSEEVYVSRERAADFKVWLGES